MSASGTIEVGLDLAAFLGVLLLSVPVLNLDRRKRIARPLLAPDAPSGPVGSKPASPGQQAAQNLLTDIRNKADLWVGDWRWYDRVCLWAGYSLLLSSSFIRIFV